MNTSPNQVSPTSVAGSAVRPIISIKELMKITGKSRSTLWRWVSIGHLPKACVIGPNSVGWPEEVIEEWRSNLVAAEVGNGK